MRYCTRRSGRWGGLRGLLVCAMLLIGFGFRADAAPPAPPDDRAVREHVWVLDEGYTTVLFDREKLAALGVRATALRDPEAVKSTEVRPARSFTVPVESGSTLIVREHPDGLDVIGAELRHSADMVFEVDGARRSIGSFALANDVHSPLGDLVIRGGSSSGEAALTVRGVTLQVDPPSGTVTLWTDEITLAPQLMAGLGVQGTGDAPVATISFEGRFRRLIREEGSTVLSGSLLDFASASSVSTAASVGPDVIVVSLPGINSNGSEMDPVSLERVSAFAVGTTSCNIGDEPATWNPNTNQHPVIAQNLYRLKNGRFEQVGMSWVKHGFFAVMGTTCGTCIEPPGITGQWLGVGCSDPYGANLNQMQNNLGPRSPVNAFTGFFPYPFNRTHENNNIDRRLQVRTADVDPDLNAGALYFVEGHYVTPDDAAAGNHFNNVSYRPTTPVRPSPSNNFCFNPSLQQEYDVCLIPGSTTRSQEPAIRAWKINDPTVGESEAFVPGEGLFRVSAKVTDLGNGFWHYEYAVYNMNSHRSAGSFRVPLPLGASVQNIGFHSPFYHSGEPFDSAAWTAEVLEEAVVWSTVPFEVNPNANALRWGTLYNFWMDVGVAPEPTSAAIGLFRPGTPTLVTVATIGPAAGFVDCNANLISDACDLSCEVPGCEEPCGGSADCNENGLPDECEPDCNDNGIADACDLRDMTSTDCDGNGIPDECDPDCDGDGVPDACEVDLDCDDDGVPDCDDLCPCTSPAGACLCPAIDRCCFFAGICIDDYPRDVCISQGGTPACQASPCRDGCLIGDWDLDGDRDLFDLSMLLECFSGFSGPGYQRPSDECLLRFDFDNQSDVDVDDFRSFRNEISGP